ncbi:MAG: DUF983 domain-containing protein [Bacteroidia bacterium]
MQGPLYSVFAHKCPKCNLGDLYADNNPYHLSRLSEMHKTCSHCGQSFEPETGFYYGAMYVSYAVSVAIMFIPAGIMYFFFDAGFWAMLSLILGIYVTMFPLIFRWSRNIWLNIFVKFSPSLRKKLEQAG